MAISPEDAAADTEAPALRSIEEVLADPGTSFWLKAAIHSLAARDPVDALNDALLLAALFDERLRSVLGVDGEPPPQSDEDG